MTSLLVNSYRYSAAATVPGAPTSLDAVPGDTEVDLTWVAPSNGGSPITDYVIQFRSRPGPAIHTDNFSATNNPLGSPWTRRNGTNSMQSTGGQAVPVANSIDSTYHYADMTSPDHWVQADVRCDDGFAGVQCRIASPFRNEGGDFVINPSGNFALNKHVSNVETELDSAGGAGDVVYTMRVEVSGNNYECFVNGVSTLTATSSDINTGLGVGIGSYRQSGTLTIDNFSAGLMVGAWQTFSDGTSTTTSATVTGLTNGIVYDFQVAAVNAIGQGAYSGTDTATPSPGLTVPDAPTALDATSASSTSVGLTWSAPGNNGGSAITDYVVQYRTTSGPGAWNTFSDGTSTSTAATVTGLTTGTSYDFQVAAVNAIGQGAYSATDTATPTGTLTAPTVQFGVYNEQGTTSSASVTGLGPAIAGDVAYVFIGTEDSATVTCTSRPTGFTRVGGGTEADPVVIDTTGADMRGFLYRKTLDGTETNVSFTLSASVYISWGVIVVRGDGGVVEIKPLSESSAPGNARLDDVTITTGHIALGWGWGYGSGAAEAAGSWSEPSGSARLNFYTTSTQAETNLTTGGGMDNDRWGSIVIRLQGV